MAPQIVYWLDFNQLFIYLHMLDISVMYTKQSSDGKKWENWHTGK